MAGWLGEWLLSVWAILGRRWVLFAGRTVAVLVVTVLVMTALVARPGAGC